VVSHRLVRGIGDLTVSEIKSILARADSLRSGAPTSLSRPPLVGLLFLEASLRTRTGFAAAAARLGGQSIDVLHRRASSVAMPESWQDTLRVVSGMVDLVVGRLGRPVTTNQLRPFLVGDFLNGGDTGPTGEHPSQALIDLYAIQRQRGPIGELTVAMCGDLRMRAARSLLELFKRIPPKRVVGISDPLLCNDQDQHWVQQREPWELADVDVLYVVGIPHGALAECARARLRVDRRAMANLPEDAVVLSPMPVIDELASTVRNDRRLRLFEQSDDAIYVRMALIEVLVS
jgi:aspartate carbamoyltransferase catalytic subunit